MTETTDLERNRRFVIDHFEAFVNRRDLDAVLRNMSEDFLDHDGPGGKPIDRTGDRAMIERMHRAIPDLRVEVLDSLAERDKVMVRNMWTGTIAETGKHMEFHGFVLWRLAGGKIVERWATVTPMHELAAEPPKW